MTERDKVKAGTKAYYDSLKEQEFVRPAAAYKAKADSTCNCLDTSVFDGSNSLPPFNSSKRIVLYDFNSVLSPGTSTKSWAGLLKGIPLNTHVYAIEIVKEIELTDQDKKTLQHILFDRVLRCTTDNYPVADCLYDPHHCLVFYDKKGRALDFLEICFMCDARRSSLRNNFSAFCGNTYCDLRQFAKERGCNKNRLFADWCR